MVTMETVRLRIEKVMEKIQGKPLEECAGIEEDLDVLDVMVGYVLFDLDATRRERDHFRGMLI